MAALAVFVFYALIHFLVLYSAESCAPYFCNEKVGYLRFPFKNKTQPSPDCGYYSLDCSDRGAPPKIQLEPRGHWFQFESFTQSGNVFINDSKLQERIESLKGDTCDDDLFNDLSLPMYPLPIINISTPNLTLFRCSNTPDKTPSEDPNYACRSKYHTYYNVSIDSLDCSAIQIPIIPPSPPNVYNRSALTAKFYLRVQYTELCTQCYNSGGQCFDIFGKFNCNRTKCWDEKGKFNCSLAQESKCWDAKEGLQCLQKGKCQDIYLQKSRCFLHLHHQSVLRIPAILQDLFSSDTLQKLGSILL